MRDVRWREMVFEQTSFGVGIRKRFDEEGHKLDHGEERFRLRRKKSNRTG